MDHTNGVDGWVSLEVSPILAYDTASNIAAAKEGYSQAKRSYLFIKSFAKSWNQLMNVISPKTEVLKKSSWVAVVTKVLQ
jgi:Transaldolase/Fructose-6-phosphate aldolase